MPLTSSQLKYLRGRGHALHPVVTVADKGLSDNVLAEVEQALGQHELIKIKLRGTRQQRQAWVDELLVRTGAELVDRIGQVACLYRRHPENPKIEFPRSQPWN